MTISWDPAFVKAQLRSTSLRLGQAQEKKDSEASITRRDIATLLQQHNVGLARAKVQKLVQEDASGDLLEVLEMHIGLILEHFNELDHNDSPSPTVLEAACSIIFAAPQTEFKDLHIVRNLLIQRLGPDFARSAMRNLDGYVSNRVLRALSTRPPSTADLDTYLEKIAHKYGVKWSPEPRRQDILNSLSEILDPEASLVVDLPRLRRLCARGIPDEPGWLRPRIWKLFLGILPTMKASWKSEIRKQRESYYDLIRRLLDPFSHHPLPSTPLADLDATLLTVSKQLSSIPSSLFSQLEKELEPSPSCPLDDHAPNNIRIMCARNLDVRLKVLQEHDPRRSTSPVTPEICLETELDGTPEISLSAPDSVSADGRDGSITLLLSKSYTAGNAHHKHSSALLRLLYLHSSINPGNLSPHLPSLLIPLYTTVIQEIEPEDLAHVEADTFWLFEAILGEFSELEDEEGGRIWMKRFNERLAWADADLFDNLQGKGLDPAQPHYSYRWLAPLLTHTLPLASVFPVWDAMFSRRSRERDSNPKIDHLIDVCTAMLIRARAALFRLGKGGRKSPSLWAEENNAVASSSPLRAWELGDAFLEGVSLLQLYPIHSAGGIDSILQIALELSDRRAEAAKVVKGNKPSLGARLKVTMWKGFTNQLSSPEDSAEELEEDSINIESVSEDGNDTETPENTSSGLTSQLATTVWRGLNNESSMDAPSSPVWPSTAASRSPSPMPNPLPPPVKTQDYTPKTTPPKGILGIWGYAEKLKDSDAAAAIAKVSSNWRARAIAGAWSRSSQEAVPSILPRSVRSESFSEHSGPRQNEERRGSLPQMGRIGLYSPPPRPAFFRYPRDSFIPADKGTVTFSTTNPEQSSPSEGGFMQKTKILQASLTSLTQKQKSPPARSGPRPLLLSSSTSITSPQDRPTSTRSGGSTPTPEREERAEVVRMDGHTVHRDSLTSVSSWSPSDVFSRPTKSGRDWDSDVSSSSRLVPLNRKSVSPMALSYKASRGRHTSRSSSVTSSDRGLMSPPLSSVGDGQIQMDGHRWGAIDLPDSPPPTSPPIPRTPVMAPSYNETARIADPERQRGSVVLNPTSPLDPSPSRRPARKKTPPPPSQYQMDETSDFSVTKVHSRSPRLRSKRHPNRPTNLNIQDNMPHPRPGAEQRPNSLAVEWPGEEDMVTTPRASTFDVGELISTSPMSSRSLRRSHKVSTDEQERFRKISTDVHEGRLRKTSSGQRTRKVSIDTNKEVARSTRDSAAEEGDDEGYDDLLSAYESEGSQFSSSLR